MGPEEFRKGIHNFLVKYAYKNAVTQDLFDELANVSSQNLNITKIMNTWTRQKGYPILNISLENKTNTAASFDGRYRITQERFLSDPEAYNLNDEVSPFDYKWEIPVTYMSSVDDKINQVWLHPEQNYLDISIPNYAKWMKLNISQSGYYRVNYPEEHWI